MIAFLQFIVTSKHRSYCSHVVFNKLIASDITIQISEGQYTKCFAVRDIMFACVVEMTEGVDKKICHTSLSFYVNMQCGATNLNYCKLQHKFSHCHYGIASLFFFTLYNLH